MDTVPAATRELDPRRVMHQALRLADRGFAVYPACRPTPNGCEHGKACNKVGKRPLTLHGFNDATRDSAVIRGWWRTWENPNIGIATGPSNVVVCDFDLKTGGMETFARLRSTVSETALLTPTVDTGGGGAHVYYAAPPGVSIPSRNGILGPGADIKAQGGGIIAPPSLHAAGKCYLFQEGRSVWDVPLQPLPDVLLRAALAGVPRTARVSQFASPGWSDPIFEGRRNEAITSLAGTLHRRRLPDGVVLTALLAVNETHCVPPLDVRQVEDVARRICAKPLADARTPMERLLSAAGVRT